VQRLVIVCLYGSASNLKIPSGIPSLLTFGQLASTKHCFFPSRHDSAQTRGALQTLTRMLSEVGCSLQDVAFVHLYLGNMDDFSHVNGKSPRHLMLLACSPHSAYEQNRHLRRLSPDSMHVVYVVPWKRECAHVELGLIRRVRQALRRHPPSFAGLCGRGAPHGCPLDD
jgi:hypothetical protein